MGPLRLSKNYKNRKSKPRKTKVPDRPSNSGIRVKGQLIFLEETNSWSVNGYPFVIPKTENWIKSNVVKAYNKGNRVEVWICDGKLFGFKPGVL